jgi:hypothetical protein
VVLAYALPYLLVIGLYLRSYQRFVIPLLPFLAILAAHGWMRTGGLLSRSGSRRMPPWVSCVGLLLVVAPAAATCCRLSWLRSRPDTFEQLAAWIERVLDPKKQRMVLFPPLYLPPLFQTEELAQRDALGDDATLALYWSEYQRRLPLAAKPEPRWVPATSTPVPSGSPTSSRITSDCSAHADDSAGDPGLRR